MKLASEDLHFLRSLAWALLALALSAVFLPALFIAYYQFHVPKGISSAASTVVAGKQFTAVMGTSRIEGDALLVTGLQTQSDGSHALVSTHMVFDAESYPYLRYKFDGLHSGLLLQLFWRKVESPGKMFTALMPRNFGTSSTFNLGAQREWQGTITDIAIYIAGDLHHQPFRIPDITLAPPDWQQLLAAVWSEWTAFKGWSDTSINNLRGTPNYAGVDTASPTLAAAIWAGLALVFLYLLDRFRSGTSLISYGAAILIPWIALDQIWQGELSTQLQETRYLFSGKTTPEKHLVDVDQNIYRYTKRLREDVLPASPARIFILHNSSRQNFERLKTQYYLLPHNIYNFNHWLPDQQLQPGDYVLALGTVPGLSFNAKDRQLSWESTRLTATIVDRDPRGTLYRVPPSADLPADIDKQQEEPNG
jgi:hypothetical protein